MMQLHTPIQAASWLRAHVRGDLHTDSRKVRAGDGFIAWPGAATDGRKFVASALQAGAAACLVEADGVQHYGFSDMRVAAYAGLKAATGVMAAAYYEQPSEKLQVLAVTGTNGKTSTAWWLAQVLSNKELLTLGLCGLVGTLGIGTPGKMVFNGLTTPDPVLLQQQFARFVQKGFGACAIEASSIGIAERRLDGTQIRVAIFTNFTQDHLDYHGSMQAYWQAKRELFDWPGLEAAVVNLDDARGPELAAHCQARGLDVWTVSRNAATPARLLAHDLRYDAHGLRFDVVEGQDRQAVATQLIGDYNASNVLGVLGALRAMGVPLQKAARACAALTPVPGRMECVTLPGQPLVAVDYAHTPDALDKALGALRTVATQRAGKLWCVFGCGGDRDASKRPLMAAIAQKNADALVITSDNPRTEQPGAIIAQIVHGLQMPHTARVQADRAQAIRESIGQAQAVDVILVAGKGHEDYQDVAGVKHPFSDVVHARAALEERART
jgi:UDP-N-acetylmuramyl-tripeptide synthetase